MGGSPKEVSRHMLYRLATLFGVPVRVVLATLTPSELKGWAEYWSEEPYMPDRIEAQLAVLTAVVAKAHGSNREPIDFMISKTKKPSLKDKVAAMFGGEDGV